MLYLEKCPRAIDPKEYQHKRAEAHDCSELYSEDLMLTTGGVPKIVYFHKAMDEAATSKLIQMLGKVRYDKSTRTNGLVTESRIFGYAPRNPMRKAPCRATAMNRESPKEYSGMKKLADIAAQKYHELNSSLAEHHAGLTRERVLPSYRIGESMFTSGIINHNNPLNYHFDTGNYKGVWSAMFGMKKGIEGGYLACPEYDMALQIGNGSLTMFDGQSILHGVTPIKKLSASSKRYTVVFYSLRGMWSCKEPYDELERMRRQRMRTETDIRKNGRSGPKKNRGK